MRGKKVPGKVHKVMGITIRMFQRGKYQSKIHVQALEKKKFFLPPGRAGCRLMCRIARSKT